MNVEDFRESLLAHFDHFTRTLATDAGKWRIAADRPGSGNTKNIGSVRNVQSLIDGAGPFAQHGAQVFDDFWMNYLTEDMARAIDSDVPYRNLEEYWQWRKR